APGTVSSSRSTCLSPSSIRYPHLHLQSSACRDVERHPRLHDQRPILEADDSLIDSAPGAGYATHLQCPQRVSHVPGETERGVNIGMLSDMHAEPKALSSCVGSV